MFTINSSAIVCVNDSERGVFEGFTLVDKCCKCDICPSIAQAKRCSACTDRSG